MITLLFGNFLFQSHQKLRQIIRYHTTCTYTCRCPAFFKKTIILQILRTLFKKVHEPCCSMCVVSEKFGGQLTAPVTTR